MQLSGSNLWWANILILFFFGILYRALNERRKITQKEKIIPGLNAPERKVVKYTKYFILFIFVAGIICWGVVIYLNK